jgi:ketosteroid isomerase-like protein
MAESSAATIRNIFEVQLPSKVRARDIQGYGAQVRHGPKEIAEGVAAVLADVAIDPTFYADEVKVMDRFGYVFGRSTEVVTPLQGGPSSTVYSRELWLFHEFAGDWKIARMIWNFAPSDPAVTG